MNLEMRCKGTKNIPNGGNEWRKKTFNLFVLSADGHSQAVLAKRRVVERTKKPVG